MAQAIVHDEFDLVLTCFISSEEHISNFFKLLTHKKYETNFLFLAISSSFYADCLHAEHEDIVLKNTEMLRIMVLRIQKFHRNF